MTMRHFYPSGILIALTLAAAGCNAFAGAGSANGASWGLDDSAAQSARSNARHERQPVLAPPDIADTPSSGVSHLIPAETVDTVAPGALLDVYLNDEESDLRTVTSERSLGTAVVRGDFFRYNTVNSDPDLRSLWGQPLLLKWTALIDIPVGGPHVFVAQLSKENGWGVVRARTLVRVDDETVFERTVRTGGPNRIFETGSRVLPLARGKHRLEVWLAVKGVLDIPADTELGTYLRIRAPGMMTAEPMQSSWVWHRVRG